MKSCKNSNSNFVMPVCLIACKGSIMTRSFPENYMLSVPEHVDTFQFCLEEDSNRHFIVFRSAPEEKSLNVFRSKAATMTDLYIPYPIPFSVKSEGF